MIALPDDQAAALRLLMRAGVDAAPTQSPQRRTATVIAVASGKGGVGKTTIAVNAAIALARRGLRTVLVDADLGTANIDVVMNVRSTYDLSHVLRGHGTINEVAVRLEDGLRLIVGASGLESAADMSPQDRRRLLSELGKLEAEADFIVLDLGAGISQNVLAFAQAADELLVVTTPEPTALTDAYALLKVLTRARRTPSRGLVVNQASTPREGRQVAERVVSVVARFLGAGLTSWGHILRDEHVALAVRQRIPVLSRYPRAPASAGISALAGRLAGLTSGQAEPSGFFRRAVGFFC